jgi:DNA-binding LacI/PurR family transcriptional regulator
MESSSQSKHSARQPTYRRIAAGLRNQILAGHLVPGQQLPSKGELMGTWNSSSFTIHTAVQTLIKEGWIESVRGAGTYVAHFENRFACAGIYHGIDIFALEHASYSRILHTSLLEQLHAMGKDTLVFVDSRPENQHEHVLPALFDAIQHRRVQCLIVPTLNPFHSRSLSRISLPKAFGSLIVNSSRVNFDLKSLPRDSVKNLAKQRCRSVGLLSNVRHPSNRKDLWSDFHTSFRRAAHAEGLEIHPEWIRVPGDDCMDLQRYGYHEFKRLWALPQKPDGLVVYPDEVARGVIAAVLRLGIKVPEQMKFVFHRNAHVRFLCPFPAIWAISDESQMARELIRMVQMQFDGEKISPVMIPHSFESDEGEDQR